MLETLGVILVTAVLIPMCIGVLAIVAVLVACYQAIRDAIKGKPVETQKEESNDNDINKIDKMIEELKQMKKAMNKNKKETK